MTRSVRATGGHAAPGPQLPAPGPAARGAQGRVPRPPHARPPAHTYASLAIAAGADLKVLQDMLGHASAAMALDQYGKLLSGRSEQVADRLDALHRGSA